MMDYSRSFMALLGPLTLGPLLLGSHAMAQAVEPTQLAPVKVEAQRDASLITPDVDSARQQIQRIAGGVAVVDSEQWQASPAATVKDVLDYTPGVFVQPKWGGDSRLSIRGSGLSRYYHLRGINLYQDGMPLNNADGSGSFQWLDPSAYRFIEVYKGANGLRYGGGTLGGAINFVTPSGYTAAPFSVRLDGGSHGWRRLQMSAAGNQGALDGFISASTQQQDGFRQNSKGDIQHLNANVGWQFAEQAETRFYVLGVHERQEIPGTVSRDTALNQPKQAAANNLTNHWQHNLDGARLANRTLWLVDTTEYEVGAWYGQSQLDHPIYEVIDHNSTDYGAYSRLNHYGQFGQRDNEVTLGLTWSAGHINGQQFVNTGGNRGAQTAHARNSARNLIAYGENRLELMPDLFLHTGLQYQYSERKQQNKFGATPYTGEKNYSLWNPAVGVIWHPDEQTQLYGNVSRSSEAPTYGDLKFDDPTALDRLKPQTATTLELGTRGQRPQLAWDLSVYHARLHDEFQCLSSPWNICDSTSNLDTTIHQGIEAGLDWTLWQQPLQQPGAVNLNTAYTFNDFRFHDDARWGNNRLPGTPRHYLRSQLLYTHPSGAFIGPNVEWVPEAFYVDNANSLQSKPYTLLGAKAGWKHGQYSWFVEARNLTDQKYIASASITDVAAPNAAVFEPGSGRSIYAGLQINY
ncbi:TonB-dependent receptor family protein [Oceanisphaera avium]|uniref:TonB-dependent receptor n=1 Tax=Oceanisphaera avium TaxID=1903694 RepID=A0A1Y0CXC4_9GAMM|nr:TonB-dependent receptor [Oceanisphaera avium]ART79664.1 hypothetical protein CBP12_05430 [Oceanisphaera avium]